MLTTLTGFSQFVINILLPYTNTETRLVIVFSTKIPSSLISLPAHKMKATATALADQLTLQHLSIAVELLSPVDSTILVS